MIFVAMFMLLAPGLIAVRLLWRKKEIRREDYKFVVCDYVVYQFLIQLAVYGLMFVTYQDRTVSFAVVGRETMSNIFMSGFVVKYSVASLLAAVVLPAIVPRFVGFWLNLEDNRAKRIQKNKE